MNVYKTILNQCYDFYLQLQDFNLLILDDLVLQVAQMYRQDVLALPQDEEEGRDMQHTASIFFGIMDALVWGSGALFPVVVFGQFGTSTQTSMDNMWDLYLLV